MFGNARMSENAQMFGDARMSGNACVAGEGDICLPSHVITVGPIGSENVTATLYRSRGEDGHELRVGCWTGTIQSLMAEVARRRENWDAPAEVQEAWVAQYKALEALCDATVAGWGA